MTIEDFFTTQLAQWPLAAENFRHAADSQGAEPGYAHMLTRLNARRTASTAARTDAASIKARPCFLCRKNRPAGQIADTRFNGYELLVNPFPIFSRHFTIAATTHTPQSITRRGADMFHMARAMEGYMVFYNGPRCGASAPDHAHFQAVPADRLPFLKHGFPFKTMTFHASDASEAATLLSEALGTVAALPGQPTGEEPMVNVLAVGCDDGKVRFTVIPRRAHRPSFYGTGTGQMLVSPASIDLAGVMITVRPEDFAALTAARVNEIIDQVCYPL